MASPSARHMVRTAGSKQQQADGQQPLASWKLQCSGTDGSKPHMQGHAVQWQQECMGAHRQRGASNQPVQHTHEPSLPLLLPQQTACLQLSTRRTSATTLTSTALVMLTT